MIDTNFTLSHNEPNSKEIALAEQILHEYNTNEILLKSFVEVIFREL